MDSEDFDASRIFVGESGILNILCIFFNSGLLQMHMVKLHQIWLQEINLIMLFKKFLTWVAVAGIEIQLFVPYVLLTTTQSVPLNIYIM